MPTVNGMDHVTYWAMPFPYDQFSFATSTKFITTSSGRTFNLACMTDADHQESDEARRRSHPQGEALLAFRRRGAAPI
jgi:hypothetical protein